MQIVKFNDRQYFRVYGSMFCLKGAQIVIQYFTAATALCAELEQFVRNSNVFMHDPIAVIQEKGNTRCVLS